MTHFDGEGTVEAIGGDGAGDTSNNIYGGGGGGGRIAVYHSGDNHWTGSFLTYGGWSHVDHGGSGENQMSCIRYQADYARNYDAIVMYINIHVHFPTTGTTYVELRSTDGTAQHKTLKLDNAGRTSAERFRGEEVVELSLSGPGTNSWSDTSFWSYGGVQVSTTGAPYEYYDQHSNLYRYILVLRTSTAIG